MALDLYVMLYLMPFSFSGAELETLQGRYCLGMLF